MTLRMLVASLAVVVGTVAVTAGPALAYRDGSGDRVVNCDRAVDRLDRVTDRIARLQQRIVDGEVKYAERAAKRLERLQERAERIANRIAENCTA